ncbi:MAG: CmcI family methyltransferase [Thiohalophilus sp.]|nr:CmcI family methyltransferase [Thiohalophilus sp.]MDZ7804399.1 CmcI family methyltransferase [Thiohalophilus sp.]
MSEFEIQKVKNIVVLEITCWNLAKDFMVRTAKYKYTYNFSWLGRPVIQFPNDTWTMQELIWQIKPDLIIETGIAHGGSLIFSASMLAMLDMCDAIENETTLNPSESRRKVLGIRYRHSSTQPRGDRSTSHDLANRNDRSIKYCPRNCATG